MFRVGVCENGRTSSERWFVWPLLLSAALFPVVALQAQESAPPPVFLPPSAEELEAIELPQLRLELLWLAYEDQQARVGGACGRPDEQAVDPAAQAELDRRHADRLQAIVAEHGWPTVDKVGSDGARSAWLLAQHADHDVGFQERALELMLAAAATEQVSPIDVAYLTDRVRINRGREQLYGTQFHEGDDGVRRPQPIEQPESVDTRRQGAGMRSLEAYTKFVNT